MPRPTAPALGTLLALLSACSATPSDAVGPGGRADDPPPRVEPDERPGIVRGSQIELDVGPEFDEIADLSYRRSSGGGRLVALMQHSDPRVRLRATEAAGRLPYPAFASEITDALSKRMQDPVPAVRHAAAFAIGLRGDPRGAGTLASYRNDPDPELRARVVEAASRLPDPRLHRELLIALRDGDPRVRIEAAIGAARWDPEGPGADEVDRALLDALRPYQLRPGTDPAAGPTIEPEFVWRVLYALSRRRAELGRGAFLEYAAARGAVERLFAVRGLARITPDAEIGRALERVLADPQTDWRAAYEAAVGLGQWGDPSALDTLFEAVEHPSAHVRAAAMEALGGFSERREDVLANLRRGQLDVSSEVRVATLGALAEVLEPGDALEVLEPESRSEDPVLRAGAATVLGRIDDARAVALLERLTRDPEPRVACAATEALGALSGEERRAVLHRLLAAPDNGVRLAAVTALRQAPLPADRPPLEEAFRSSRGDVSTEIAFNVLENLGAIGDDPSRAFVEAALEDPRPWVAHTAHAVLARDFGAQHVPPSATGGVPAQAPHAGKDYRYGFNPLVEVVTSRGSLVFELFPAETPVHVHNFVQLARNGYYDGLAFHRVVPDFVVQGGDYRGDGNGARPWNEAHLPHEFTPRKTTRGSLGMPRNDDPESGGSQFFVTHRPTPHLDGRYTIFGELRQGGDVLDRIEVGDRILSVRPLR